MSQPSVLVTLIEIATKALDEAAEALGLATKGLEEAKAQAAMLRQYRQDYVDKLQTSMGMGVTKEAYQNYQQFLFKLDQAIDGQDQMVIHAEHVLNMRRQDWQAAQRKKRSYEVLVDRAAKKVHLTELKRDQKMMDEYAMRSKKVSRNM